MDVAEALEQFAPVTGKGAPVGADHDPQELLDLVGLHASVDILDRRDQRRVADDPELTVDDAGQLPERLHAVLRAALRDVRVPRSSAFASFDFASRRSSARSSSTSRREYQISRFPIAEYFRIPSR